jgi:hypothetical protein
MPKNKTAFQQAVADLREENADKLKPIFEAMYKIATGKGSEDKDSVNAAKVCMSLLGTPKPPTEKSEAPKDVAPEELEPDELTEEESNEIDELLNA